jgi:hypothetical protein
VIGVRQDLWSGKIKSATSYDCTDSKKVTKEPAMTKEQPNTNCLEGIRCPNAECGSYGPFTIACSTWARVSDDGIDETYDMEWDEKSGAICRQCDYDSTVRDFSVVNQTEIHFKGDEEDFEA